MEWIEVYIAFAFKPGEDAFNDLHISAGRERRYARGLKMDY
jgi:hypothetical protein